MRLDDSFDPKASRGGDPRAQRGASDANSSRGAAPAARRRRAANRRDRRQEMPLPRLFRARGLARQAAAQVNRAAAQCEKPFLSGTHSAFRTWFETRLLTF